jgi:hypothetical protein
MCTLPVWRSNYGPLKIQTMSPSYLPYSPESSRWRVGPHAEASHRLIVFGLRIARHFFGVKQKADLDDITITHISISLQSTDQPKR